MNSEMIAAERKDACMLSFAICIRTLAARAELVRDGAPEAAKALLEAAEGIGNMAERVAETLARPDVHMTTQ